MATARWNGAVLVESDDLVRIEGNLYFRKDQVDPAFLRESDTHTVCPWKGTASYYHVVVDGEVNRDAAWYYPEPKEAADRIRDRIAFWKGVEVTE